jgi:acetoin utilization deacetylase AcuC-like enzyme
MSPDLEPPKPRFSAVATVALADDELFLEHVAPPDHPERGPRLLAVRTGLERAGQASAARAAAFSGPLGPYLRLGFGDVTDEQLARVHAPSYVEQLGHLAGRSGHLDADTYLSPGSVAAARRAAGAAVALVDTLLANTTRTGIAVPRPPGHHALRDQAMGFCLLNNVAVAAAHARAHGRQRVLVLDWDVHHGNGTEAIFYDDPSVLFVSLHQHPNYPGTGAARDLGHGDGRGRNVNIPLPAGGTDGLYRAAFQRIVLPLVEQFAPDFALVSCGFDAHERDPLAEMRLTARGYAQMTRDLLATLPEACPLGVVLEGGYDLQALTESTEAVASELLGIGTGAVEASTSSPSAEGLAALTEVESAIAPFWRAG